MSNQTIALNNGQQAIVNTDRSKTFLRNIIDESSDYTNGEGMEVTLLMGTVMGRISATGKVIPLVSDAVDGSQYPIGILMRDYTVADTVTQSVSFATSGEVAEEKVVVDAGDTLSTVIDGRQLRDRIGADTVGITLIPSVELTKEDNQ